MSSNMRIQKVCQHCKNVFTAKTTVTKFCSDECAKRNYKKRMRAGKLQTARQESQAVMKQEIQPSHNPVVVEKEFIGMKELALLIGLSERTLFRLIKDEQFPKLRIGKRLLFKKNKVVAYLETKYGNL